MTKLAAAKQAKLSHLNKSDSLQLERKNTSPARFSPLKSPSSSVSDTGIHIQQHSSSSRTHQQSPFCTYIPTVEATILPTRPPKKTAETAKTVGKIPISNGASLWFRRRRHHHYEYQHPHPDHPDTRRQGQLEKGKRVDLELQELGRVFDDVLVVEDSEDDEGCDERMEGRVRRKEADEEVSSGLEIGVVGKVMGDDDGDGDDDGGGGGGGGDEGVEGIEDDFNLDFEGFGAFGGVRCESLDGGGGDSGSIFLRYEPDEAVDEAEVNNVDDGSCCCAEQEHDVFDDVEDVYVVDPGEETAVVVVVVGGGGGHGGALDGCRDGDCGFGDEMNKKEGVNMYEMDVDEGGGGGVGGGDGDGDEGVEGIEDDFNLDFEGFGAFGGVRCESLDGGGGGDSGSIFLRYEPDEAVEEAEVNNVDDGSCCCDEQEHDVFDDVEDVYAVDPGEETAVVVVVGDGGGGGGGASGMKPRQRRLGVGRTVSKTSITSSSRTTAVTTCTTDTTLKTSGPGNERHASAKTRSPLSKKQNTSATYIATKSGATSRSRTSKRANKNAPLMEGMPDYHSMSATELNVKFYLFFFCYVSIRG
jgi:hypothetical protein